MTYSKENCANHRESGNALSLEERRRILREKYPVWEKVSLYEHLARAAAAFPARILYRDICTSASYAEVLARADRAASAFLQLGVRTGDRVAVNLNNTVEYLYLTFALAKIGAVKVPFNRKIPLQQKCYILDETGAKIYVSDKMEDLESLTRCAALQKVVLLKHPEKQGAGIVSWENFMGVLAESNAPEDPQIDAGTQIPRPEDIREDTPERLGEDKEDKPGKDAVHADLPCDIIYTSGSSGNPKGVVLSHDMILRSAFANCLNRGFQDGRRALITVPLFHVYGYIEGLLSVIFVGGTLICMQGRFDPYKTLQIIEDTEANDILCVPSAIQKIMAVPEFDSYDFSSLHAMYCSASVCPEWLWDQMREKLGEIEIITGYGMSEVSGASVQTPPEASLTKLRHTFGKPLTDHFGDLLIEYRVIDPETLEVLPDGRTGELICRGAIVTKGYFHREDVNAEVFLPGGWLRSGDMGWFEEDGYLVFLGRGGENYKINGENVSPVFVDQVISESQDVVQAETVGVPDEKLGWIGVAFIQPTAFCPAAKNRIIDFCAENLASFQVPKYYFFMHENEWPRTPNGKVTKRLLRELAIQRLKEM